MAQRQKTSRLKNSGLILFSFFIAQGTKAMIPSPKLGTITQAKGEVTFLNYLSPKVKTIKQNDFIEPNGSYLTQDNAFITAKLFDGSWIRVSPATKFSLEFDQVQKYITLHLFTGSVKVLFSSSLNQGKVQKFLVKSSDALFETSEGKFILVRNNILGSANLYVEKGLVLAMQMQQNARKDIELVHGRESVTVVDKQTDLTPAHPLTEKEMGKLKSNAHLRFKYQQ